MKCSLRRRLQHLPCQSNEPLFNLRFALPVQFAGPSEKKTWFNAYCGRDEQGQQMSCLKVHLE